MRAHQPGSTPIDIPETVPNPAYTPAPAPERAPTKVPEKVPEKVISGIADATSNGGLNPRLLISGSPFDRRAPLGLMSIAKAGTPQLACRSQTHMTGHFVPNSWLRSRIYAFR